MLGAISNEFMRMMVFGLFSIISAVAQLASLRRKPTLEAEFATKVEVEKIRNECRAENHSLAVKLDDLGVTLTRAGDKRQEAINEEIKKLTKVVTQIDTRLMVEREFQRDT